MEFCVIVPQSLKIYWTELAEILHQSNQNSQEEHSSNAVSVFSLFQDGGHLNYIITKMSKLIYLFNSETLFIFKIEFEHKFVLSKLLTSYFFICRAKPSRSAS